MKKSYAKWPYMAAMVAMTACAQQGSKEAGDTADSARVPAFEISNIDSTAQPCDNFDEFANGNWKKNNPIPGTESRWGSFNVLDKQNKEIRLKGIIDEIVAQTGLKSGTEEQQIADYYKSFLDTATIEKLGITPLQPWLDKINGVQSLTDWVKVTGELQQFRVLSFFKITVDADERNSKVNAVHGEQDGLTLGEKSYYERQDSSTVNVRKEYVQHIDKMFSLAGFKDATPGQTILTFETKLAGLQLSNVALRDPVKTYNKTSYASLKTFAPAIDWDSYTGSLGVKTDTIILQNIDYLKKTNSFLKGTSIETLKTYTRWQLLTAFANSLPKQLDDESFHFFGTIMRGTKAQKTRGERAIRSTDFTLGMPLGKLFVKKYFPESSKQKVSEMIENVRKVYGQRIDQLSWMSDSTKKMAHQKLAAFTYKIGYPDKWKDYSSIKIQPATLIENNIAALRFKHQEKLDKIGKPVDKSEWLMSPQTVNAYYNPVNNEVVFPAGILQPPFFNPNADDAINYGGIIAVIGHEFTHGFDDQGSQFDAEGNLRNWWTPGDRANFDKLAKRYTNYFNGIEALPGFPINGSLTLGENIADLGGLTLAYYALKQSLEGKPEPALIDGFTWQQRFFLGWAQVWHTNITDAALRNQIQTDPHSPATARINAPLRHLKEFADAWKCAPGSKMVLSDSARIVIW